MTVTTYECVDSREQLDRLYNPTLWTQRLPADELLPSHIDFTTHRSEQYRQALGSQFRSVTFGDGEHAGVMDVFRPEGLPEDAPIVIYIHGGWWQWFSIEQFSFVAEPLNRNGFAVYMPGYRMAQDWQNGQPMESIVKQMEIATADVLKEAAMRGARGVYLVGHSAGGQLVTLLRQTDWSQYGLTGDALTKLKGVFSLAGLFDLRPLCTSFVNDAIQMTAESAARVSPQLLELPSEPLCPLHLLVPEYDTPSFFSQTREYQHKVLESGQPCVFKIVSSRDHLDMIERLVEDDDELLSYLVANMRSA